MPPARTPNSNVLAIAPGVGSKGAYRASSFFSGLSKIEWIWPNWLPAGMVSVLVGEPEAGKSTLALRLTHSVLTGENWPDGSQPLLPPKLSPAVVWCEAESGWSGHKTRLEALGTPLERFFSPIDPGESFQIENDRHLNALGVLCMEEHPALVVVDALGAAQGGDENSSKISRLFSRLSQLALAERCNILVLHHPRKADPTNPRLTIELPDLRGSGAIGAAARTVLALDNPFGDEPEYRRLRVIKSNFSPEKPSLGYYVEQTEEGRLLFHFGAERAEKGPKTAEIVKLLVNLLNGGKRTPADLYTALSSASAVKFSHRTFRRAIQEAAARRLIKRHYTREEGYTQMWLELR